MPDDTHMIDAPEPEFTLRAGDPLAADLVRLWAALRDGDWFGPVQLMGDLADAAAALDERDEEQIADAVKRAHNMDRWQRLQALERHGIGPRHATTVVTAAGNTALVHGDEPLSPEGRDAINRIVDRVSELMDRHCRVEPEHRSREEGR